MSKRTIHETVYFWQGALCRLNLGKCHQSRLEYSARALKQVAHCHDMAPPQTLGELCIELHEQMWRNGRNTPFWMFYDYGVSIDGAYTLRRAMYHKHTDPKKERLYQLIDKIRNA